MSLTISATHRLMKWKAFAWIGAIDFCADDTAKKGWITSKIAREIVVHNAVLIAVVRFEQDSAIRSTSNGPRITV
jgi:hypothetical protein